MRESTVDETCPCGSGNRFSHCCGPFLNAQTTPVTAVQLMRSRYTAYVRQNTEYLRASWHAATRPDLQDLSADPVKWLGLKIIGSNGGGQSDNSGTVEFIANCLLAGRQQQIHEVSRFVREGGRWFYVDGDVRAPPAKIAPGRNDPCPCGSGKKYKKCCISSGFGK